MATNFMKNEDNWIHLKTDITNPDGSTILWKWCQKRNHPKSDNTSVQNIQVSGKVLSETMEMQSTKFSEKLCRTNDPVSSMNTMQWVQRNEYNAKDFIYSFLERGEEKGKERKRNINVWLPLMCPVLRTWPAAQACALTGNWTGDPLVLSPHWIHWATPARVCVLFCFVFKETSLSDIYWHHIYRMIRYWSLLQNTPGMAPGRCGSVCRSVIPYSSP